MKLTEELNERIILKAIKHLDEDALAKKLAKKMTERLSQDFEFIVQNDVDISHWIMEELTDEKTVAGKRFSKAIASITKRMADSIEG